MQYAVNTTLLCATGDCECQTEDNAIHTHTSGLTGLHDFSLMNSFITITCTDQNNRQTDGSAQQQMNN